MVTPSEVVDHFRREAATCRLMGSRFTGDLLEAVAMSVERPGLIRDIAGYWPGRPAALAARLASALHAAVLSGRDAELARHYPSFDSAGDPRNAWVAGERFIDTHRGWVTEWLKSPPQTNEVKRASGLFSALSLLAFEHNNLPLALLELGASAGLNLCLDGFAYRNAAWRWGESSVVIDTDWRGPAPPALGFAVETRLGCDQNPLDVSRDEDCLRLLSYIWPDQFERTRRIRAAMRLARDLGIKVDRRDAGDWIAQQLAQIREGRLTVVYHSIFYHYPPKEVRQRIESTIMTAGERATASSPLAWLRYEFEGILGGQNGSTRCLLDVISWPGSVRRTLADADSHGLLVNWR